MIARNTLKTIIRKVFKMLKYILLIHIITTTLSSKRRNKTMTIKTVIKSANKILSKGKGENTVTNDTQN